MTVEELAMLGVLLGVGGLVGLWAHILLHAIKDGLR